MPWFLREFQFNIWRMERISLKRQIDNWWIGWMMGFEELNANLWARFFFKSHWHEIIFRHFCIDMERLHKHSGQGETRNSIFYAISTFEKCVFWILKRPARKQRRSLMISNKLIGKIFFRIKKKLTKWANHLRPI